MMIMWFPKSYCLDSLHSKTVHSVPGFHRVSTRRTVSILLSPKQKAIRTSNTRSYSVNMRGLHMQLLVNNLLKFPGSRAQDGIRCR